MKFKPGDRISPQLWYQTKSGMNSASYEQALVWGSVQDRIWDPVRRQMWDAIRNPIANQISDL